MAAPGAQPTGIYAEVAQIKDRARQQTELARQISRALHVRDMPLAQELIEDGAEMFWHAAMVAAVEMQARQGRMAAIDAVRDVEEPKPDALTPL
jgi:hypothetical protein